MSPNTALTLILTKSEQDKAYSQPAIMDKQQENERDADRPESILNLSCSKRDELITILAQLSTILQCNTAMPEDAKQRTCKKIENSIRLLVELLPFKSTRSTEISGTFEERIAGRLIVGLPKAERLCMIGHLIAIREAVLYGLITVETKRGLISENKRIIDQLLDLSAKEQNCPAEEEKDENCEALHRENGCIAKNKLDVQINTRPLPQAWQFPTSNNFFPTNLKRSAPCSEK